MFIEQLSDVSPIGTILAWVPKPQVGANPVDLPNGWLLCDGSSITQGPWAGGKTPNLNSIGAFLRGGNNGHVLEIEQHQVEDHHHADSGHKHSCSASSSASSHHHTYTYSSASSDAGDICGTNGACADPDTLKHTTQNTGNSGISISTSCGTGSVHSGLGGVSSPAKSGGETRPINMKVIYVMRCW